MSENEMNPTEEPQPDLEQEGWVDAGYDGDLSAQPEEEIDPDEIIASAIAMRAVAQIDEDAMKEQLLRGSVHQEEDEEEEDVKFYIWEQWATEGDKAYAAFSAFRDTPMFHRSVNAVYRKVYGHKPDNTTIKASPHWRIWAKRFDWRGRAQAFDQWKHRRSVDEEIDEATKARNEVKGMSRKLLQLAARKMIAIEDDPDAIHPRDLAAILTAGAKTNFMAHGISEKKDINIGFSDRMETKVEVVFIDTPNEEQRRQEAMEIKEELTQTTAEEEI